MFTANGEISAENSLNALSTAQAHKLNGLASEASRQFEIQAAIEKRILEDKYLVIQHRLALSRSRGVMVDPDIARKACDAARRLGFPPF